MSATSPLPPLSPRAVLRQDHLRLDSLLDDLSNAAAAGVDKLLLCERFDQLEAGLIAHFETEERELFPKFVKSRPGTMAVLSQQHRDIRELLTEVGIQIDLGIVRTHTIQHLVRRLREHAAEEDTTIYHWAERTEDDDEARKVIAQLMALMNPIERY